MKRIIFMICIVIFFGVFIWRMTSLDTQKIKIMKNESYFSDFEVIGNQVLIECFLTIKNDYSQEKKVKLFANMEEDVAVGLLKKALLPGENKNNKSKEFIIPAKSLKSYDVVFVGEHGGNMQKVNRNLPNIQLQVVE